MEQYSGNTGQSGRDGILKKLARQKKPFLERYRYKERRLNSSSQGRISLANLPRGWYYQNASKAEDPIRRADGTPCMIANQKEVSVTS